jgi:hypothetical protein
MVVDELDLAVGEAVQPTVATHIAAIAAAETFVFRGLDDSVWQAIQRAATRLRPLAERLLADRGVDAWFAPADLERQVVPINRDSDVGPGQMLRPADLEFTYVVSGEVPRPPLVSSTVVAETIRPAVAARYAAGEFRLEVPFRVAQVRVAGEPMIFEVRRPMDWYRLCEVYPRHDDGWLVPDWSKVRREWDGVHLTLGGLILGDQVEVTGPAGRSRLRFWDFEQTQWLRPNLLTVERTQLLDALPEPPFPLPELRELLFS